MHHDASDASAQSVDPFFFNASFDHPVRIDASSCPFKLGMNAGFVIFSAFLLGWKIIAGYPPGQSSLCSLSLLRL